MGRANIDMEASLRFLLLVISAWFSAIETPSTAAFQIVRPTPNNNSIASDIYDKGVFTFQDKIANIHCQSSSGEKCTCDWGETFVLITNNKNLTPTCMESFEDVFGCKFHFGGNYVRAVNITQNTRSSVIGTVKYSYNTFKPTPSIESRSYWNMTWHTISTSMFNFRKNKLEWSSMGTDLSKYKGLLLKLDLSVSHKSAPTSGCLLLKVAGTRVYPLTPYVSRMVSQRVTSMPTTSVQVKSSILLASSSPTVILSFTATRSSPSRFDHTLVSSDTLKFNSLSLVTNALTSLPVFDMSMTPVTSAIRKSHTSSAPTVIPSIIETRSSPSRFLHRVTPTLSDIHDVSSLSSLITSALSSLPTFDMSMTSVSTAIRISHASSLPLKSIVSTSQGSLYIQQPDSQTRKFAPSSAQGVMSDTTSLKASSGHLETVGRSANFQSTKYFTPILRSTNELPFQSLRSSLPPSSSTIAGGSGGDTSKQSGDNVPLIIGALFGGLFGVVAIVIGALLFRRKFCGGEHVTKGDQLQLPSSPERYHRNGSVAGMAMKSIDNGVYLEAIDLKFRTSSENKRPRHVYENGLGGTSQKIQPPDQVYSEIGVPEEPVYGEVDEPIYKEVAEEDGPIYKEVSEEDGPIYKEVAEEDGPIYKEVSEEDGPIFEEKDSKYQPLDEHVIENPNVYQFLHNESNPSRPQSPVYQIIDPAIAHSDK